MNGKGSRPRPTNLTVFGQQYDAIFRGAARPGNEVIPPITDPMGQHWHQPDPAKLLISATEAFMSQADFDQLAEYSWTLPTGQYAGKMWKALRKDGFILVWFPDIAPGTTANLPTRKIVLTCSHAGCKEPAKWQAAHNGAVVPNGRKLCQDHALIFGTPGTILPFYQ